MDSKKGNRGSDDRVLNVAPDDSSGPDGMPAPPRSYGGNQQWNSSKQGLSRVWNNYRTHLGNSFKRLPRYQQEALVGRMCLIITVGVTGLALLLFYSLINRAVRIVLVPAAICGAWYAANKLVTPVVLARLENYLNEE